MGMTLVGTRTQSPSLPQLAHNTILTHKIIVHADTYPPSFSAYPPPSLSLSSFPSSLPALLPQLPVLLLPSLPPPSPFPPYPLPPPFLPTPSLPLSSLPPPSLPPPFLSTRAEVCLGILVFGGKKAHASVARGSVCVCVCVCVCVGGGGGGGGGEGVQEEDVPTLVCMCVWGGGVTK